MEPAVACIFLTGTTASRSAVDELALLSERVKKTFKEAVKDVWFAACNSLSK